MEIIFHLNIQTRPATQSSQPGFGFDDLHFCRVFRSAAVVPATSPLQLMLASLLLAGLGMAYLRRACRPWHLRGGR